MPLYRDEGVVLRTAKLGEADRIITLLTKNHGKVRAVAKGVRRTKSRFGARLEPFMRADLLIAQGHSLDVVSQAESVAAYAGPITADYESYTAANVIVETADKLVSTENERTTAQYRLVIGALNALAKYSHAPAHISGSYVMRALAIAGWEPRLSVCVVCGERPAMPEPRRSTAPTVPVVPVAPTDTTAPTAPTDTGGRRNGFASGMYLSMPAGGLMCGRDHTPDARRISPAALPQLNALVDGDWTKLDGADLLPETEHLVEDWAEYYLERPLRSMRLLD